MNSDSENADEAAKSAIQKGDSLIFGVGCLFFGVKPGEIAKWEEYVTETLNHLPRVSRINVTADMDSGWISIDDHVFPIRAYVEFKVSIPLPLQRQLLAKIPREMRDDYSIEDYRVVMFYEYDGPVAFVVLDDPSATLWDSSLSIIIVREYLKKELPTGPERVRCNIVGPSPFHGDFAVLVREQAEPVALERTPSRGYDDFVFSFTTNAFTSATDAAEHLFEEIKDELTFFYYLKAGYNEQLHAAAEINTLTGNLIEIYENKGILARLRRLFTSSSKMRYLGIRALTAEYDAKVRAAADARKKDALYSSDVTPYFSREIENVESEDFSGTLSGARDLAGLLSEVRARQVEVTSLFLSAVAGGVAGALISLLVH